MANRKKSQMQWYRMDLHIHTPASADYQERDTDYIDILRKAEFRGLDILAFTDHNTVAGYAAMMDEIDRLGYLAELGRAHADELRLLNEYRRLRGKILVLPGFEFTATFGFHILGVFSPQTPIRQLEHLLLSLNVPLEALDHGNSNVGASADVLTAYRMIHDAGGICVAAHANTTHGVAMRGLDFGGQTRIAYTQDRNLHALEVTDLSRKGRTSTQRFFNGTKSEYPRRMRCIQGSDAHRINALTEKAGKINLGVGDRITEVLLPACSFDELLAVFRSNDFSRSRPHSPSREPYDFIQIAREEGPSLVQSFHEAVTRRGGRLYSVIADVCGFANTNGGTVYVGVSADKEKKPVGIQNTQEAIDNLYEEINHMISPVLEVEIDTQETQGKTIIRIQVPRGDDPPYAIDENKIYVRDEADTSLAVRDEIVNLVRQGLEADGATDAEAPAPAPPPDLPLPAPVDRPPAPEINKKKEGEEETGTPRSGVEIVGVEQRNDTRYYIMRDLRNGNIVKNVTRSSARKLWHYAISQKESNPIKEDKIHWQGRVGLWRRYQRGGTVRYDLVQRENGKVRVYYGVTEGGMHGLWQAFLSPEDDE